MEQVACLKSWDKYKVNSKNKLLLNQTLQFSTQRSSSNLLYNITKLNICNLMQHWNKLKAPQLVVSFINILVCIFNRVIAASKMNSEWEWAKGFWKHHNTNYNNSYSEKKTGRNTYLVSCSKKSWIILKSFFNQLAKPIK